MMGLCGQVNPCGYGTHHFTPNLTSRQVRRALAALAACGLRLPLDLRPFSRGPSLLWLLVMALAVRFFLIIGGSSGSVNPLALTLL
jgi:hypothetical protein